MVKMSVFPGEDTLLRLVGAVRVEIDADIESECRDARPAPK